jgi:hypothetical protein
VWKSGKVQRERVVHNEKVETIAGAILSTTRTMYFSRYVSFFCFFVSVSFAAGTKNALTSVQKADHYADLYNWADAKPFFLAEDRGLRHMFDVNYFSRSATIIFPDRRQLHPFLKRVALLHWC